jgi:hypothetical protein
MVVDVKHKSDVDFEELRLPQLETGGIDNRVACRRDNKTATRKLSV